MKFLMIYGMTNAGWGVLPDSVGLPSERPVFVPDFDEEMTALPMVAIRIGRLGKCIEERFAARYIAGVAPALQLMPKSAMQRALSGETPQSASLCFDSAVITGEFTASDNIGDAATFIYTASDNNMALAVYECKTARQAIAGMSLRNTLKTGDIILLPSDKAITVSENLIIEATDAMGEKLLLRSKFKTGKMPAN